MNRFLRYFCLVLVSLFFAIGGVAHFTNAEGFVRIIPFLPYPLAVVYITGVIEFIAVALLWVPRLRQQAGTALFIYTICVTPANIYMLIRPELFPEVGMTYHVVRLAGQVVLLAIIWWSTRMPTSKPVEAVAQAAA